MRLIGTTIGMIMELMGVVVVVVVVGMINREATVR